ncbi:methylenetetrahydrofolate reductase (NAD(P)H) met13 [Exophiala xenobiotica]|nr:methylenetetrahydrofolate reductase (NAD(P)H) met13 [Exophiala xenobiotica]KAK5457809.1 methylenetetrahydrofolate reductase (NAD(P)H) met13 [Exophiala xenobiotica]KAK5479294.1 methylenetetrahydrofolate reductase (NAD(P)H) met13 [Exophiala xenobiotica]KAK5490781.1 methylenetetrahydrofolate reductase (NAD(P)H) met13 [Exophiala xenobiotica]KAK5510026.1 methylenetetrahydrofolate reductase (NAD(P)H) met13 [Exophiala xenobiotica]
MHISNKLALAHEQNRPTFSFEFFPPKTAQGVQNLYDRMDRMHDLGPAFIDITWGAGGRNSQLTCEMALRLAHKAGCSNILALRGDPPRDKEKWEAKDEGFKYAKDLVKYIRAGYGDAFDIGVAGYSEGCDDNRDVDVLIDHLKEKVDAGASFIITQMFYNVDIFLDWVKKCRERGINVPIIPGIMPISTYASFIRRAEWTKCHVPSEWYKALEPVKNDDAAVREVGKDLIVQMCRKLLDAGILHLHFYTMNLAQATRMILEELSLTPETSGMPLEKPLPWRQSLGLNRRDESVRPIFWRNRNTSYIARTADWDEFPNGRWGDSRSPAFGELDAYGISLKGTNEGNIKLWNKPKTLREVSELFVRFLSGQLDRLPWSEGSISGEATIIKEDLLKLNKRGLLTINSQPAVDGAASNDPVYGWGPPGGWVYQKAYLELFVFPSIIETVIERLNANKNLTYYAVNNQGKLLTNAKDEGPNAVTWGIFPNREVVQPTIVETVSFLAWKDEAFRLGEDWAKCYPAGSATRKLIEAIMAECYLVNIVNNDFHQTREIFEVFEGLEANDLDKVFTDEPVEHTNGTRNVLNGDAPVSEIEKNLTTGEQRKIPFQTNGTALAD